MINVLKYLIKIEGMNVDQQSLLNHIEVKMEWVVLTMILGITIGVLVGVVMLLIILCFFICEDKQKAEKDSKQEEKWKFEYMDINDSLRYNIKTLELWLKLNKVDPLKYHVLTYTTTDKETGENSYEFRRESCDRDFLNDILKEEELIQLTIKGKLDD